MGVSSWIQGRNTNHLVLVGICCFWAQGNTRHRNTAAAPTLSPVVVLNYLCSSFFPSWVSGLLPRKKCWDNAPTTRARVLQLLCKICLCSARFWVQFQHQDGEKQCNNCCISPPHLQSDLYVGRKSKKESNEAITATRRRRNLTCSLHFQGTSHISCDTSEENRLQLLI